MNVKLENNKDKIAISCTNLCKSFFQGKKEYEVLKNVNLDIEKGKTYSLVGESGSGKSTLLHVLGTLEKPSKGDLEVLNKNTKKLSDKKRTKLRLKDIGFVYQYHHLFSDYSALENIVLPQLFAGKRRKKAENRAKELLSLLNLEDRVNHRPSELSGGQQQRVAIARALANNPRIILADEPTGNLDSDNSKNVMEKLIEIVKSENTSLVIATHNVEITHLTDRVIPILDGNVTFDR